MIDSAFKQAVGSQIFPVVVYYGDVFNPVYLSTIAFDYNGHTTLPLLASAPTLQSDKKSDLSSNFNSVEVSIFDKNDVFLNELKLRANTKVLCELHMVALTTPITDHLLMKGYVFGNTQHDDDAGIVSFTLESDLVSSEVGYTPADDGFESVEGISATEMWPIAFGKVARLKAVRIGQKNPIHVIDGVNADSTEFHINSRDELSSGSVELLIGGVRITGDVASDPIELWRYNGDELVALSKRAYTVTITAANLPYYTNVPIVANTPNRADVLVINTSASLVGLYCLVVVGGERLINKCVSQDGTTCYFESAWTTSAGVELVLSSGFISSVAKYPHKDWLPGYQAGEELAVFTWNVAAGADAWTISSEGYADKYIIADHPITEIAGVYTTYARVRHKHYTKSGATETNYDDLFGAIPRFMCDYNLSDTVNGRACATVSLSLTYKDLYDENADVYVSFNSGRTTNVAEIIQWLIEEYTDLTVDATTFAEVTTKVSTFPANFALTEKRDAITLAQEIAWQARCALNTIDGVVYITYLSEIKTPAITHTNDTTSDVGLRLSTASGTDLPAKLIATWRRNQMQELALEYYGSSIGVGEESHEFYIYSHHELVKMSLYFWGYRMCRSWPQLSVIGFLDIYGSKIYDQHLVTIPEIYTNTIRGDVESCNLSLADLRTNYVLRVGANGDTVDNNYWLGDPDYPVTPGLTLADPLAGEAFSKNSTTIVKTFDKPEKEPKPQTYYGLRFISYPLAITRNTNFAMSIELWDATKERRLNYTGPLVIQIQNAEDAEDLLYLGGVKPVSVTMSAGHYAGSTFQVKGGHKRDARIEIICYIPEKLDIYAMGVTYPMPVVDNDYPYFKWLDTPRTVIRGQPFVVRAEGDANFLWDLAVHSDDADDVVSPTSFLIGSSGYIDITNTMITGGHDTPISGGLGYQPDVGYLVATNQERNYYSAPFLISDAHLETTIVQIKGLHPDNLEIEGAPILYLVDEYPNGPLGTKRAEDQRGITLNSGYARIQDGAFCTAHKILQFDNVIYYISDNVLMPAIARIKTFESYDPGLGQATFTVDIVELGMIQVLHADFHATVNVGYHVVDSDFSNMVGLDINVVVDHEHTQCFGSYFYLPKPLTDTLLFYDSVLEIWTPLYEAEESSVLLWESGTIFWYAPTAGATIPHMLVQIPSAGVVWLPSTGIPYATSSNDWSFVSATTPGIVMADGDDFQVGDIAGGSGISVVLANGTYTISFDGSLPSHDHDSEYYKKSEFVEMDIVTNIEVSGGYITMTKSKLNVIAVVGVSDITTNVIEIGGPCPNDA